MTDTTFLNTLKPNPWTNRILEQRPLPLIYELHSGVPCAGKAKEAQKVAFESRLADAQKGPHLLVTSTSELSKYFQKTQHEPLFVALDRDIFVPLTDCTDLFAHSSDRRSITRLYAEMTHGTSSQVSISD